MKKPIYILISSILFISCGEGRRVENQKMEIMKPDIKQQYGYNRDFLNKYVEVVELKKNSSAILLVPAWQGRVMTSTADGEEGFSFGWINHELISSGKILPHINAFGGEERLWMGPEGGQFSLFFKKDAQFIFDEWQTPAFLDTEPFEIIKQSLTSVLFARNVETENYSGTKFKFRLEREVALLDDKALEEDLNLNIKGLNCVAYRSGNTIINTGDNEWTREKGLLSIWMLGMFNPSPAVVVAIPFKPGDEKILGPPVNDNYFGRIPGDRLKVTETHIFFRADGKSRGKIGLPPQRAAGNMGSYDSANNILTLLICRMPEGNPGYVNSSWELQEDPFSGDALNSYNDGPLEDGTQMGPFYELESSSPGAALKPGDKLNHIQYTLHLTGNRDLLNDVSIKILGVSLAETENAFQ